MEDVVHAEFGEQAPAEVVEAADTPAPLVRAAHGHVE